MKQNVQRVRCHACDGHKPLSRTTPERTPETAPERTLERTLAWTLMRKLEKTLRENFENYIYFLELFEYSKY